MKVPYWRTRGDPFNGVREEVRQQIEENPGLEAKPLFEWLHRRLPEPVRCHADQSYTVCGRIHNTPPCISRKSAGSGP
jgi:hypothetical protein